MFYIFSIQKFRVLRECFFELKPLRILEVFRPEFVRQIHLQKICKKIWKKREGICKRKGLLISVMFKFSENGFRLEVIDF